MEFPTAPHHQQRTLKSHSMQQRCDFQRKFDEALRGLLLYLMSTVSMQLIGNLNQETLK